MTIKKIDGGIPSRRGTCLHPAHTPPMHMVYEPGVYEWTCDGCGKVTTFTVPAIAN